MAALFLAALALSSGAGITPQLTVNYPNVQSLAGTNYYGVGWTNGAVAPLSGNTETNLVVGFSGGSVVTNTIVYRSGTTGPVLQRSSWAQPIESAIEQFELGDVIPWPPGVASTNVPPLGFVPVTVGNNAAAYYQSTNPAGAVLFIPSSCQIIAAAGGNVEIDWQLTNGVMRTVYTLSSSPNVRPSRVFWTEDPYDSPPVSLNVNGQQIFAVLHYNNYITRPTSQAVTNLNPDGSSAVTTQYLDGVWIDGSGLNQQIRADGIEGMMLIEYFADGNYANSLGLYPVQILRPQQNIIQADIGSRLLPSDLYYGTDDLTPNIKAGSSDGSVLLYAQPGPKYNWVFAQMNTVQEPWAVCIYWEHPDLMGVSWPFEVDWYSLDWPADPPLYILGDTPTNTAPILVPQQLTAQIPFQEVANNAVLSTSGRSISVAQIGRFLVKYTTQNDIWYDALQAVAHDDSSWFDLSTRPWPIGTEMIPYSADNFIVRFDGASGYAEAGVVENFDENQGFTVEAWAFRDARVPSQDGPLVAHSVSGTSEVNPGEWELFYGWGTDLYFGCYAGQATWPGTGLTDTNQWHHLAGVYDGTNILLYVDGILRASAVGTRPIGNASYSLWMGRSTRQNSYFCGKIDEVRLWSYPRSAAQIQSAMNAPLNGNETGLAAYYPLNEGSGTTIHDLASKWGAYGTLHGQPTWMASFHLADTNPPLYAQYPGYIYQPAGNAYNPYYYRYPSESNQTVASAIFGVNTQNLIELWWALPSPNTDMPTPVYYPSLVQRYQNVWPTNPPQIVIASALGHTGIQAPGVTPVTFDGGANPSVYYQNTPGRAGFNPNEEHALALGGVVYALRNDLNSTASNSSAPYVLVDYTGIDPQLGAHPAMAVFSVVATNATYPAFTNTVTAGMRIQPPLPLAAMPGADNTNTTCFSGPGWRDRKTEWWAKAAGNSGGDTQTVMRFWYALQNGFYFPSLGVNQLPSGTLVPWLSGGVSGQPINYTFRTLWPANVPELMVAQTIYQSPAGSGLPDISDQLSVDVLYQQSQALYGLDSVQLIDPLAMRGTTIADSVIQAMASAGVAQRQSPGQTYTFPNVEPSLGTRLVYDPNQPSNRRLYIEGSYVTTLSGGYLLLNLLENCEYSNVYAQADGLDNSVQSAWQTAVTALPRTPLAITPNTPYVAAALSAGHCLGTGYVTVAFNNSTNTSMVAQPQPISLSILCVVPVLAPQTVVVLEPDNALDEQLTLRSELDFGGSSDDYFFEWRTLPPTATGLPPTNTPPDQWNLYSSGPGVVGVNIEGATIYTLVDNYFQARYRPAATNLAVGTNVWSAWSLAFAPGWIQRVLDAITPFEQRMTDMSQYEVNRAVTMLQQAGAPYNGPVALNGDAMDSFGLIQIYQTVLERGEMLSVDAGMDYAPANASLLLAVSRLSDLYMVLGNEAYGDAQDPTIAYGGDSTPFGSDVTSMFCFDNLVPSLLDEELALLRGRDNSLLPSVTTPPFYNRLPWNFTYDITGGEVAYALNYAIYGVSNGTPTITATDAAALYPQGHGDAWGHYLSALMGYYDLLINPNYTWIPGISSVMLGSDIILNVGYAQEQRFAEVAAARARAGVDIVKRTHRKFYSPASLVDFANYWDADRAQCWGMGDWAARAGQASYFDWVTANSLLTDDPLPASQNWAIALTNTQSWIALGSHDLDYGSPFTIEFWLQTIATNSPDLLNLMAQTHDNQTVTNTLTLDADGQPQWTCQEDGLTLGSSTPINDGDWHHVAMIYTGTGTPVPKRQFLVDGQVVGSANSQLLSLNQWNWVVGARQASPGGLLSGYLQGNVDELRIWRTGRDTNDIALYMNICLTGHETGLLAYYPFYAGTGNLANDEANNNQGTINNAGWARPVPGTNSPFVPPAPNPATNGAVYYNISHINRDTIRPELDEIASSQLAIQSQLDAINAGLNPLGLDENAVPFDISPAEVDQGKAHFDQIYERSLTALYNAYLAFKQAEGVKNSLRRQYDSTANMLQSIQDSEVDYHNRLIEIFGYPFTDDIGPGATYPQGYSGPDLVNYGIVDLQNYIGTAPTGQPVQVAIFNYQFIQPDDIRAYDDYNIVPQTLDGSSAVATTTMWFADTGIQVKPPTWTGQRQANGEIQRALGEYIRTWYALQKATDEYQIKMEDIESCFSDLQANLQMLDSEWELWDETSQSKCTVADAIAGIKTAWTLAELALEVTDKVGEQTAENIPDIIAGGAGVFSSPVALTDVHPDEAVKLGFKIAYWAGKAVDAGQEIAQIWLENGETKEDVNFQLAIATNGLNRNIIDAAYDFEVKVNQQYALQNDLFANIQALDLAAQRVRSLLAEGQRLLDDRTRNRSTSARTLQTVRYTDMAFRIFRDEALQRYTAAFDLAARYTWLAAKAYDYETGLLGAWSGNPNGLNALAQIANARALGRIEPLTGRPQIGGTGDPGLSDVLARLKANWDVVKTRMGFNNPDLETRRISLRAELLRTSLGSQGDGLWQNALNSSYRIDNLNTLPEFLRYCKPFTIATNCEPALVLPFSTAIYAGQNAFGLPLAGGDNAFNPSHAATKIRGVGVWFFNYNNPASTNATGASLANDPAIYLVPVGYDILRSSDSINVLRPYSVLDQALPVPYTFGPSEIIAPDYIPIINSLPESIAAIRRHPAFRAFKSNSAELYFNDTASLTLSDSIANSRLVGRSVWNTRWLLIIPGRSLLADPDEGLNRFIYGAGSGDGPANRDGNGVKDIRILFHTYSIPGE